MSGGDRVKTMAALGRPFHLGSLYDARSDQIIAGVTLWNKSDLEKATHEQGMWSSGFEVITSDSIRDKASALDISGSLSLSILGGLIKGSGSMQFIDNKKTSTQQERVTLQYKCTTKAVELTMDHLGLDNITHPHIIDQGFATHVVTGIEYGAHAFFVFDRKYDLAENEKVVKGKLHAMINIIPAIVAVEGNLAFDASDQEYIKSENITVKFCGDYYLKRNPATYQEAFSIYKELPNLLGENGENAVPVRVRLFPLVLLNNKAGRLVRDISSHLVCDTEKTLETLDEFQAKCYDLMECEATKVFSRINQEVSEFVFLIETLKRSLQSDLSLMLPAIRGGGKEESCLAELLKRREMSPFGNQAILSWINRQEEQIKILNGYLRSLKGRNVTSEPGDLQSVIMNLDIKHVLCLVIFVPNLRAQIDSMREHLKMSDANRGIQITEKTSMTSVQPKTNINMNVRSFKEFADCNEDEETTKFVITEESCDSDKFSALVRYYKNGNCITEAYEVPLAPANVEAGEKDVWHDHITVHWSKSVNESSTPIQRYRLMYKEAGSDDDCIKLLWSNTNHITLPDLKPNTRYDVCVQSWCEVGYSPRGNITVCTRPASPPGQPTVHLTSNTAVHLSWSPPKIIARGCSVTTYTIRQRKTEGNEEWLTVTPPNSTSDICYMRVNIQKDSPLEFGVAAVCSPGGQSQHSPVNDGVAMAGNPASKRLKKDLTQNATVRRIGPPCIYQLQPEQTVMGSSNSITKYEIGNSSNAKEKSILLVGATGTGKTTLINAMVNYVYGVTWNDPFRLMLCKDPSNDDQSKSQTKEIIAYKLNYQDGFQVPHSITIIDTPGFGSTEGLTHDNKTMTKMQELFTARGLGPVEGLDAVCFVVAATQPKLTPTQQYTFDKIISIFGTNITDNSYLLFTFADGKKPESLTSIKRAKFPYKKFYKFNNCFFPETANDSTEESSDEDDEDFNRLFWNMGQNGYKQLLNDLVDTSSMILPPTRTDVA